MRASARRATPPAPSNSATTPCCSTRQLQRRPIRSRWRKRFVPASRLAAPPSRPACWTRATSPPLQPLSLGPRSGMPYPDRFYPVVDSVAWVARLALLGVGTIQLRAKNLSAADALQTVKDALEVI